MRDTMPPPHPRQHTQGGDAPAHVRVCAAERTHHCTAAQAWHTGHRAAARTAAAGQRHRTSTAASAGTPAQRQGDFKRTLSELNTYAIIMQSFRRFSMQLRCVSSKTKVLFIILIFYRLSVFNALRPVCCEMDTVLAK